MRKWARWDGLVKETRVSKGPVDTRLRVILNLDPQALSQEISPLSVTNTSEAPNCMLVSVNCFTLAAFRRLPRSRRVWKTGATLPWLLYAQHCF